jgi:hypothetical protein
MVNLLRDSFTIEKIAIVFFSEEFIWLLFTKIFSEIFSPNISVYILSLLVSLFVLFGCLRTGKPIVAAILWVVIPVGLSTVGLFQLRQGLAYSLFFYGAYYSKPGKIGLLSCAIHTSLTIPYLYYMLDLFFRRFNSWIAAATFAAFLAAWMATIGGYVFETFGGRRLESFDIGDGAESINYVISSLLFAAFYLSSYAHYYRRNNTAARIFSFAGFGVSAFVIFSFYIFPIGTSRIGYFLMLFALPLLSESGALNLARYKEPRVVCGSFVILFIVYQAIKSLASL